MDFYRELIGLKEEELNDFIKKRIVSKELESIKYNDDENIIGYLLPNNPNNKIIIDNVDDNFFDIDINCFHSGYVRLGTQVVYGIVYDSNGISYNDGKYYYVDDESYVYDFCSYIRNFEVSSEFELMDYMLVFIRDYFGYMNNIDREEMFTLIRNVHNKNISPVKEHGLSWFKNRGNALCSEYSVFAQNLLNVFGIDSYLVIGREKTGDEKGGSHAFNIIEFIEDESKEQVQALVDFSNYVNIYDLDFNKCGESPFIGLIDNFDDDFVNELIEGEKHMLFDDYAYVIVNDKLAHLVFNQKRDYFIANELIPDAFTVKNKKRS